jgi:GNAT superfamily N-acetyltransferase
MTISRATPADLPEAVGRLALAFAQDRITEFLLQRGPEYERRLTQFFTLLMRARIGLEMPVVLARDGAQIQGAAMGHNTANPTWPDGIAQDWDLFEKSIPGLTDRMAIYDEIAEKYKPSASHYYLGVIGVDPRLQGSGIGKKLLQSFSDLSAADRLSNGVYLETAEPSNVRFYERAGLVEIGQGKLGSATLWCMYLRHRRDDA